MKVAILDDYFDTLATLRCFEKLAGHEVTRPAGRGRLQAHGRRLATGAGEEGRRRDTGARI